MNRRTRLWRIQRLDRDGTPKEAKIYSQRPAAKRMADRWEMRPSTGRVTWSTVTVDWEPIDGDPA